MTPVMLKCVRRARKRHDTVTLPQRPSRHRQLPEDRAGRACL